MTKMQQIRPNSTKTLPPIKDIKKIEGNIPLSKISLSTLAKVKEQKEDVKSEKSNSYSLESSS